MHRRHVLYGLTATAVCSFIPAALAARDAQAAAGTAIPILMFHKVNDMPQYPEDITSAQLDAVLRHAWEQGFRPVSVGDILAQRVDAVVPAGCKPLGITADDAHPSILFSKAQKNTLRNAASFIDIFEASTRAFHCEARATLFIGCVEDDRITKTPAGYFGGLPLPSVLDRLSALPNVELGYHTRPHTRMIDMGGPQVRALLEDQMQDFRQQGVLARMAPILAYPYGVPPNAEGINELKKMGFKGAVLAIPGVGESRYTAIPHCVYDGSLVTDAFHIPRVCIGAFTYAPKNTPEKNLSSQPYLPVNPLDDFQKDVMGAPLYVSRGRTGA